MIILVVLLTFFILYINYLIDPLESPLALILIINAGILNMGIVFLILKLMVSFFTNGIPIELEIKETFIRVTYTNGKDASFPLSEFKAGQPLLNDFHSNKYFIIYKDISSLVEVENRIGD
ncbi:hypothetical protein [Lysinibacillus fusiformis]|uniref:hypothetical protein n=1 Tax=Lysinibacillus fusiformis TaxID=28031 RepID=UPI001141FDEE|nr:hypothetical protein [Lysinibacillus fusiformis]MED4672354.1 hypothetical protein [Lysinibacillus fusiformis]